MSRTYPLTLLTLLTLSALYLLAACANTLPGATLARDPRCQAPKGDPSQASIPAGPMVLYGFKLEIEPRRPCGPGQGRSVTVVGHGHRRFIHQTLAWNKRCTGREHPPKECARRCVGRPLPREDCLFVSAPELGAEVRQIVEAAGYHASVGYSGCHERSDQPGFWKATLIIHDWAAFDLTLQSVADRMRAWRVGDALRIAVRPIACGIAL